MNTSPLFFDEMKLSFDRQTFAVLEGISDGFISLDARRCFIYNNRAAEIILRKKREDLLGKTPRAVDAH